MVAIEIVKFVAKLGEVHVAPLRASAGTGALRVVLNASSPIDESRRFDAANCPQGTETSMERGPAEAFQLQDQR